MKMLIFDTETSGFNPGQICQLSYTIIDTELKKSLGKNFYFTVDFVDSGALQVHGLSVEKLKELSGGQVFNDFFQEIEKDFNSVDLIIGHNVKFDIKFISAEFDRCGKVFEKYNTFCTMQYYTDIVKSLGRNGKYKWPKLEETIDFLQIDKQKVENTANSLFGGFSGYHDSRFDVAATYLLVVEGLKKGYIPAGYFTSKKTLFN